MYPVEVSVISLPTEPSKEETDKNKPTKRNTPEEKNVSHIRPFGCFSMSHCVERGLFSLEELVHFYLWYTLVVAI